MKNGLLAIAASLFLLASCNETKDSSSGGNDDHAKKANMYADNTKEVYRAIETGDVSKLDSFIAKDVVDHEGNMGRDIVGLDSLKQFLSQIHNYFDGLKIEMLSHATSPDGEYHYSMMRMKGKSKANPWGMPVGMDVDDTGIDVVKLKDGKCVEHWSFTSQKDIMEMMQGMQMQDGNMPPQQKKDSAR